MCDIFSGYKFADGTYKFHTDEDVIAAHEKTGSSLPIDWNDAVGHEGWRKCFGKPPIGAIEVEGSTSFPHVIPLMDKMSKMIAAKGSLDLRGLTSAQGLKLPTTVEGWLDLSGLTSAQGLKLPTTVKGSLDLRGLTSAQGLKLPTTVKGSLYLSGLTSAQLSTLDLSKYILA